MKYIYLLFFTVCITVCLQAQTATDSVKATVNQLFAAMKNSDSAALSKVFSGNAIMQTIVTDKDGKTSVRDGKVADFCSSIGKAPKGALDERITFGTIQIDNELAIVWTPYQFYLNDKLRHCGTNSFQLVRIDGVWKIQYIIDTRRMPCN